MNIFYRYLCLIFLIINNLFSQSINDKVSLIKFLTQNNFYQNDVTKINESEYKDIGSNFSFVSSIDVNRGGNVLAVGYEDGTIRLWDVNSGGIIKEWLGHNKSVKAIKFSSDEKILVSSTDNVIKVWSLINYSNTSTFSSSNINSISISYDKTRLAASSNNGNVLIYDLSKNKLLYSFSAHNGIVNSLDFSVDNNLLTTAGSDSVIKVWNCANWSQISKSIKFNGAINAVNFSFSGLNIVAGCNNNDLIVLNSITGDTVKILKGHNKLVNKAFYTLDDSKIISGDYNGNVFIWDTKKYEVIKKFKVEGFLSAIILDGSRTFFNCSEYILVFDVEKMVTLKSLSNHIQSVSSVAISPDGKIVATGSWDKTVKLWNLESGNLVATLCGHTDGILSLSFSPDGERLVSAGFDKTVKVWSVKTGLLLNNLLGHTDFIWKVNFSPDGSLVVSSDWSNTVKLWNTNTGELLKSIYNSGSSFAFTKDGRKIVVGGLDFLKIFDFNGNLLKDLSNLSFGNLSVTISMAGDRLALGCIDKSIRIIDLNTYSLLKTISTNDLNIISVQFSKDDGVIIGGGGKSIVFFDSYSGNLLQKLDMDYSAIGFALNANGKSIVVTRDKYIRYYNVEKLLTGKKISGYIFCNGLPLSGVNISITGSNNIDTYSNEKGFFSVNLAYEGKYKITPFKKGYTFDPKYYEIEKLISDEKKDFLASIDKILIEGKVYFYNNPLSDVIINLSQDGVIKETNKTDYLGKFSFSVDALRNYVIKPFKSGFSFQPSEKSFSSIVDNQNVEFLASNYSVMKVDEVSTNCDYLFTNYPNPFNPSTTILYNLPQNSKVSIKIYNIYGREITKLVDGIQEKGSYSIVWKPESISSGVYYAILLTNYHYKTIKLLYMK